jgi:hypothetical protein
MKTSMLAICGASLFALALFSQPARGQTASPGADATPTPTPTATPGPPTAEDVVKQSAEAQLTAGSVHIAEIGDSVSPKLLRIRLEMRGDESFKSPVQLHLYQIVQTTDLRTTPHRTAKAHGQAIGVGDVVATRTNGGAWKCQTLSSVSDAVNQVTGEITGSGTSGSGTTSIEFASPATVTIGTTPAWHIHETVQIPGQSSSDTLSEEINLYISQTDNLLLRETAKVHLALTLKIKNTAKHIAIDATSSADYSNYGETVNITLPRACQASAELPAALDVGLDPRARLVASARAMERMLKSEVATHLSEHTVTIDGQPVGSSISAALPANP